MWNISGCKNVIARLTPNSFDNKCFISAIISTIVQVTYGIEVTSAQDEYVVIADEAVHKFNEALQPGRFLVDFFPLRELPKVLLEKFNDLYLSAVFYVPAWFPGAGFQNFGRKMGEQTRWLMNSPFQRVKDAVVSLPLATNYQRSGVSWLFVWYHRPLEKRSHR